MENEDSVVVESLRYKDLIALKECSDKYRYKKLALHRKDYERKKFIRMMFSGMMEEFKSNKSVGEICTYLEARFKDEFLREWFDFDVQYKNALQFNVKAFTRMIQYLTNGFVVKELNVSAAADINFSYKNICISDVLVKAPVILQKEDKTMIVLFEEGVNPFSEKAKKITNHPSCSVALCCAYLAFEPIYGSNIIVETWYLKGKDDKPGRQVEIFENKPGKNIARACFSNRKEALLKLKEALLVQEERNCNNCIHKDVCTFSGEIRMNPEKQLVIKDSSKPHFTQAQEEVVNFTDGAMCCIAVPGAGKTFSLANRLVNLLQKGVSPSNILFVTFTKKAASELKERVMSLMHTSNEEDIPDIFTFNAFGYTILRENPLLLGHRVKIASMVDRLRLIKEALSVCPPIQNVSYEGAYLEFGLIRTLSKLFEEIAEYGREHFISKYKEKKDVQGILSVYDEFCKLFNANGYISYDMQISLVNELFAKYPFLVKKYTKKYQYIMVDEYQDTNAEQAAMIYSIAKIHGNIVVVGDDDQNIYAWRGGSNRFMLNFACDFPSAHIVRMSDNFRSNTGILASANQLICKNSERISKELVGHKEAKFRPVYWKQTTVADVKKIVSNAVKNGYNPGDIAVLARTNKRLEEVAIGLGSEIKVASPKDYMREDTVFILLYDIFTLFYKGMDEDVSLFRVLSFLGIKYDGKKDRGKSFYESLILDNQFPKINKMQAGALEELKKMKDTSVAYMAAYKLLKIFKCIQYSHGLSETLAKICMVLFEIPTHPVVDNLIEKADEQAIVKIKDLYALMNDMLLFADDSRVGYLQRKEAVNLLTVHDSKGSATRFQLKRLNTNAI